MAGRKKKKSKRKMAKSKYLDDDDEEADDSDDEEGEELEEEDEDLIAIEKAGKRFNEAKAKSVQQSSRQLEPPQPPTQQAQKVYPAPSLEITQQEILDLAIANLERAYKLLAVLKQ